MFIPAHLWHLVLARPEESCIKNKSAEVVSGFKDMFDGYAKFDDVSAGKSLKTFLPDIHHRSPELRVRM